MTDLTGVFAAIVGPNTIGVERVPRFDHAFPGSMESLSPRLEAGFD